MPCECTVSVLITAWKSEGFVVSSFMSKVSMAGGPCIGKAPTPSLWLSVHTINQISHCTPLSAGYTGLNLAIAKTDLQDAIVPLSTLPGRAQLYSADSGQCDTTCIVVVGSRAFWVTGSQAWNQLPTSLRSAACVATFKKHLKVILFLETYR